MRTHLLDVSLSSDGVVYETGVKLKLVGGECGGEDMLVFSVYCGDQGWSWCRRVWGFQIPRVMPEGLGLD